MNGRTEGVGHDRSWSSYNQVPGVDDEQTSVKSAKPSTAASKKSRLRKPSSISLSWKYEILAWLGSLCCFLAIVVVLRELENRTLPEMRFGLTPNAIIGLLATFTELLLLVPVHSSIGQIKWLRALRQQPMDDFRVLDEATRGPWGSALLLAKARGGITASFGAVIFLLSLAIGTFVQQTLRYETAYDVYPDAGTTVATTITGTKFNFDKLPAGGPAGSVVPDKFLGVPYVALLSKPATQFSATADCPTGNCTWDPYTTLGICNACQDIASKLNVTKVPVEQPSWDWDSEFQWPNDTNQHLLPNGFGLKGLFNNPVTGNIQSLEEQVLRITTDNVELDINETSGAYEPYRGVQLMDSVAFPKNESKLFSVFVVSTAMWAAPDQVIDPQSGSRGTNNSYENELNPPLAFECMLQWCIRTMHGNFTNGIFNEIELGRRPIKQPPVITQNMAIEDQDEDTNTKFSISAAAYLGLGDWLSSYLQGDVVSNIDFSQKPTTLNYTSVIVQGIYKAMNGSLMAFPYLMDNLANSLSLKLRTLDSDYDDNAYITGNSITASSRAIVRWPWLTLLIVELVGSLLLLVIVLIQTKRNGLHSWSNNILAVFFHGLDERPVDGKVYGSQTAMNGRAKKMLIELQQSDDGGRLVILNQ